MSVQPQRASATSVVAELRERTGVARGQPAVELSRHDLLPEPLMDELAEKLSNRLVETLADRITGAMADLTGAHRHEDSLLRPIPEAAKLATSEQLAARYQLSVQWVESRAANLGATPISDSTNSKLRYHLATADAYMDARRRRPPARGRGAGGRKPKPRKRTTPALGDLSSTSSESRQSGSSPAPRSHATTCARASGSRGKVCW